MADRSLRTILCLMALSVVCWDGSASATDTVTEVKMSPDLRRVIMKSSGKIANHNAFQLDRPPRLVIEIPGVSPGKVPKSSRAEHNGGVKIDVSESKSGTHVVLDFGGAPVPQYHIRRMDAYLIVFLEDWRPPQGPAAPRSASNHKSGKTTSTVAMTERNKSAIPAEEHRSDVIIKSAEVVDGLMVLVVADKMRPERLYRIDLGVNFQLRGFVCAEIHSLPPGTGPAPSPESGSEVSGEVMPSGPKRGPTKAAGPVRMTASQGRNEPRTEWYTPATTLRGLAFGPTRFPRRAAGVGPVSQSKSPQNVRGAVPPGIPRMSVTDKALTTLQAHRRAPLLRAETCGFAPPGDTSSILSLSSYEPAQPLKRGQ